MLVARRFYSYDFAINLACPTIIVAFVVRNKITAISVFGSYFMRGNIPALDFGKYYVPYFVVRDDLICEQTSRLDKRQH